MRPGGLYRVAAVGQVTVNPRVRDPGLPDDNARAGFRLADPPAERKGNPVFFKQLILQALRVGEIRRIPAENGILRLAVPDQRNRYPGLGVFGDRLRRGSIGRGGVRPVSPVFPSPARAQQQKACKQQSKESFHMRYLFL